ncbi:G-protein coupled receptor [Intoshia linei]|uniref:G-protein coupled receptor n=1 Tax=Intoshia linei TaxID=1819745 RepID=A0A177ARB7_9BILA|nr:G-protein coupled receptor [Intoshia linei]
MNFTNINNNSTTQYVNSPTYEQIRTILIIFATCITSITAILGNVIVLFSFFIESTLRQPSNYFIASLAVSDILIGSISIPIFGIYIINQNVWKLGNVFCDLWLSVDYTVCLASIYTVLCITIDRYCSIFYPTLYHVRQTKTIAFKFIATIWLFPSLLFFITIFGWQYFVGERTVPDEKCYIQYMDNYIYTIILQIVYFWITIIMIFILYIRIYQTVVKIYKKQKKTQNDINKMLNDSIPLTGNIPLKINQQSELHKNKNIHLCSTIQKILKYPKSNKKTNIPAQKAFNTISIIVGVFIFCWMPWHIMSMIVSICGSYKCVNAMLYDISYWMCYLNSPINPFCYALANKTFQKTFIRILKFKWNRQ